MCTSYVCAVVCTSVPSGQCGTCLRVWVFGPLCLVPGAKCCACERNGRERQRAPDRERETLCLCVCVCVCVPSRSSVVVRCDCLILQNRNPRRTKLVTTATAQILLLPGSFRPDSRPLTRVPGVLWIEIRRFLSHTSEYWLGESFVHQGQNNNVGTSVLRHRTPQQRRCGD